MVSYLDQTLSSDNQPTPGNAPSRQSSDLVNPSPYQPRRPRYNDDQARRRLQESGVGVPLYDQAKAPTDALKTQPYRPELLTPPLSPYQPNLSASQTVMGQSPLATPPNRQEARQRSRLSFTPDYGVPHSGPIEPLPPREERVKEAGAQHRIYPAPTEISPPENIDVGWPAVNEPPSRSRSPQAGKSPEGELVSGLGGLVIEMDPESETESQPTLQSQVTISSPGEQPKRSGSYVPWEPVRYANPLPEEPLPTREELLETLGRMKRNSRDGPKVHSPRTSKFPSEGPKKEEAKRDEGWGARTKRLAGTAENLMEIDGGGWGQPAAQQVGGNETGWDHSPATKQAVGGDKRTESTSAWGITSAPQPAPKIHPDRLKMMGGGPPLSTAPPRQRYPPTFDADRLSVRETITGPRQRWGERVNINESRFEARPKPPHIPDDATMEHTPDDGDWGTGPSGPGEATQSEEDHGGW
ncbi:hypothetical protein DB88DRAFT_537146 [Papiliotrema laurentii]|uniref:Uncharacterized protein n=1 Tax=Papiliotrema laurentii TaxID=5418 RepID=A0AAD9FVR9_PAPLA|nr:hypothetical protein DB88DRAFT_537146 [Papiliotrema laurentii]